MVGVDTHRDEHVLAVVVAPAGAIVAQRSVPANARGYAQALRFAQEHADGARVWAVEGAGHYGAGLARALSCQGETVCEIGRGPRDERRLRGKDDSLDATRAARTALASETLSLPRAGQRREALRLHAFAASVLVVIVFAVGALAAPAAGTAPVTGRERNSVVADWFEHGRFLDRHSCAAVVVARASVGPAFKVGTQFVHALDLYELARCGTLGHPGAVKVGMSDRQVAGIAGVPVPWRSGPHSWWYRKPGHGRTIYFTRAGYVSRIVTSSSRSAIAKSG